MPFKNPSKVKIYYAHCKSVYGSQEELRDINLLKRLGFRVLNPSDPIYREGWRTKRMAYGLDLLKQCQAIAFKQVPFHGISAGVLQELKWAKELNIPIIEIPYKPIRKYKSMSIEETRDYINGKSK